MAPDCPFEAAWVLALVVAAVFEAVVVEGVAFVSAAGAVAAAEAVEGEAAAFVGMEAVVWYQRPVKEVEDVGAS